MCIPRFSASSKWLPYSENETCHNLINNARDPALSLKHNYDYSFLQSYCSSNWRALSFDHQLLALTDSGVFHNIIGFKVGYYHITDDSENWNRINITSATLLPDLPTTSQPPSKNVSSASDHPQSINIPTTTSLPQLSHALIIALTIGIPAFIILVVGVVLYLFRRQVLACRYCKAPPSLSLYTENPVYDPFSTTAWTINQCWVYLLRIFINLFACNAYYCIPSFALQLCCPNITSMYHSSMCCCFNYFSVLNIFTILYIRYSLA